MLRAILRLLRLLKSFDSTRFNPDEKVSIPIRITTGWWFGTMEFHDFSHHIENVIIPTDELSIIFQRGRAKNHQPDDIIICM